VRAAVSWQPACLVPPHGVGCTVLPSADRHDRVACCTLPGHVSWMAAQYLSSLAYKTADVSAQRAASHMGQVPGVTLATKGHIHTR
jgi:hypothetical protein